MSYYIFVFFSGAKVQTIIGNPLSSGNYFALKHKKCSEML